MPKLTPEMKAQAEDLEQSVFAGRYTADVHVRYYTNQATLWWWCDLIAKIAVSILSVVAFCVPFVLPSKPNKFLDYAWRIAGLAVLLFALWMSYLSFGDWYRESSALADRWLDHSREWNELELKQADLSSVKVREEIARLDASKTAIEKDSSKSYSRTMLKTAQQQENEHLGIASSGN